MKKIFISCFVAFISIPIIVYVFFFGCIPISEYPKDWADFATYLNGTIGIILSALNIYIFYILTNLATYFSSTSSGKQLLQSMFQSYKHSIDALVIEFFRSMESLKLSSGSETAYIDQAKDRLVWISSITESFLLETKPILKETDYYQIESSCKELDVAIVNLMNSNFNASTNETKIFLDKKSNFIQIINQIIFNYGRNID